MAESDLVEKIVQQTLEAVNSGRDDNIHTRIAVIENQFAGLNKSLDSLTLLVQESRSSQAALKEQFDERVDQFTEQLVATLDQTAETLTTRLDTLQQHLANTGKFDAKTVMSYAGTIATIVGGFWGVAVRPIYLEQENLAKDLNRIQQQQTTLQTQLTEHEKLVTHAGTKVLLEAMTKQIDELRQKVDHKP